MEIDLSGPISNDLIGESNILFNTIDENGHHKLYSISYPTIFFNVMDAICKKYLKYNGFLGGFILENNRFESINYRFFDGIIPDMIKINLVRFFRKSLNAIAVANEQELLLLTDPKLYNLSKMIEYMYIRDLKLHNLNEIKLDRFKNDLTSDDPLNNDNVKKRSNHDSEDENDDNNNSYAESVTSHDQDIDYYPEGIVDEQFYKTSEEMLSEDEIDSETDDTDDTDDTDHTDTDTDEFDNNL